MSDDKKTEYCSFCGKAQDDIFLLVAGPNACICDECIDLSADIVRQKERNLIRYKKAQEGSAAALIGNEPSGDEAVGD